MSFLNTLNKGLKGAINAINTDEFEVKGNKAKCTHCGHEHFDASEAQLNTAGLTFLNLDWANRSATVLVCKKCTFIMWFASEAKKIF